MKTVMMAHDLVRAGSAGMVVAGGMESMTNAPYLSPAMRGGAASATRPCRIICSSTGSRMPMTAAG